MAKREDLLKKVKATIDKASLEYMEDKFGGPNLDADARARKVTAQVKSYLEKAISTMIGKAVGLEVDYEGYRILYNSPLRPLIEEAARAHAQGHVRSYLEESREQIDGLLRPKLKVAIAKAFRDAYEDEVLDLAREYAGERARQEFVSLMNEAGIAPDDAPGKDKP
jgi:hypothetical protein